MARCSVVLTLLLLFVGPANAVGLVFDNDESAANSTEEVVTSDLPTQSSSTQSQQDEYHPTEPPAASTSPYAEYDPAITDSLSQQPGETEAQYLERSKRFYEQSSIEMKNSLDRLNESMKALSPDRLLKDR